MKKSIIPLLFLPLTFIASCSCEKEYEYNKGEKFTLELDTIKYIDGRYRHFFRAKSNTSELYKGGVSVALKAPDGTTACRDSYSGTLSPETYSTFYFDCDYHCINFNSNKN